MKLPLNKEARFVIAVPTGIEPSDAGQAGYVGALVAGETKGFWLLSLAAPLRGRATRCHFLTNSSHTFDGPPGSGNPERFRAIQGIIRFNGGLIQRASTMVPVFKTIAGWAHLRIRGGPPRNDVCQFASTS